MFDLRRRRTHPPLRRARRIVGEADALWLTGHPDRSPLSLVPPPRHGNDGRPVALAFRLGGPSLLGCVDRHRGWGHLRVERRTELRLATGGRGPIAGRFGGRIGSYAGAPLRLRGWRSCGLDARPRSGAVVGSARLVLSRRRTGRLVLVPLLDHDSNEFRGHAVPRLLRSLFGRQDGQGRLRRLGGRSRRPAQLVLRGFDPDRFRSPVFPRTPPTPQAARRRGRERRSRSTQSVFAFGLRFRPSTSRLTRLSSGFAP